MFAAIVNALKTALRCAWAAIWWTLTLPLALFSAPPAWSAVPHAPPREAAINGAKERSAPASKVPDLSLPELAAIAIPYLARRAGGRSFGPEFSTERFPPAVRAWLEARTREECRAIVFAGYRTLFEHWESGSGIAGLPGLNGKRAAQAGVRRVDARVAQAAAQTPAESDPDEFFDYSRPALA